MKHWKVGEDIVKWEDTESKQCSPFSPTDVLSQKLNTMNPILLQPREVWTTVHRLYKLLPYVQRYSSIWHNPSLCIGKTTVYWKQWHSSGIRCAGDLYTDNHFRSYRNLMENFGLKDKEHFWKYLQIQSWHLWSTLC